MLPSGPGRRLIAPLTPSGRPRRCEDGARGAAPASRPGAGVSKTGVIFGVEPGRRFSTSSREVARKRHPLSSPQSLSPRNARACANEALADVAKQVQEQPPTAALEAHGARVLWRPWPESAAAGRGARGHRPATAAGSRGKADGPSPRARRGRGRSLQAVLRGGRGRRGQVQLR